MICDTIGLTADSYASMYVHGGLEVEEVYGGLNYAQPIFYKMQTITGTAPIAFDSYPGHLTDYTILGNSYQDGTPSPDMPVDVVGCGVKTGNVMPAGEKKTVEVNGVTFSSDGNGRYHISGTASQYSSVRFNLASGFTTPTSVSNGGQGTLSLFNNQSNINVALVFYNGSTMIDDWKMWPDNRKTTAYNIIGNKYVDSIIIAIGSGETVDMTLMPEFTNDGILPPEFEPYGYKLPLTVNGTEYPIYLGQVETTRRIKKLVLTGDGNVTDLGDFYNCGVSISSIAWKAISSTTGGFIASNNGRGLWATKSHFSEFETAADFKSYLAAQYAAGTPVTVWYVLAEPETGIVNEPLHKIGDYADAISMAQAGVAIPTASGENVLTVPTEVPPSSVSITGHIKPVTS